MFWRTTRWITSGGIRPLTWVAPARTAGGFTSWLPPRRPCADPKPAPDPEPEPCPPPSTIMPPELRVCG